MHIALAQQRRFTVFLDLQVEQTTTRFLATLRGTQEIMAHQDLLPMERKPSAASLPTDLACMTWQAMFGSGARIGIALLTTPRAHLQTTQDPRLGRPVCCAAAAGTATPTTAARRSAATTRPAPSTPTSGSVSGGLRRTTPQPSLRSGRFHAPPLLRANRKVAALRSARKRGVLHKRCAL